MQIRLHPHAADRLKERGATVEEVRETVLAGECRPAKFGRTSFVHVFQYEREWKGKHYQHKQVEVLAVEEDSDWLVITVITRYF